MEGGGGRGEEEGTDLDLKHKEDSENCSEGKVNCGLGYLSLCERFEPRSISKVG